MVTLLLNENLALLQFEIRLNVNEQMKALLLKGEDFWIELLNDYLVNVSMDGHVRLMKLISIQRMTIIGKLFEWH